MQGPGEHFPPPFRNWTSFLKDNAGLGQGENEWLKQIRTAARLSKTRPSSHPGPLFFFFFFKQNFSFLQEEGGKDLRIVKRAEEEQR